MSFPGLPRESLCKGLFMETKIKELLSQLTLEEKAGLCSGKDFWRTKPVERLGIPSIMVSDGPSGLRTQHDNGVNAATASRPITA